MASTASMRSSDAAAWARFFAPTICASSAMSRSRSCAPISSHNPMSRARFQREAQIVARLQHPAIVTVFDYGGLARWRGVSRHGVRARRGPAARAQAREDAAHPRARLRSSRGVAAGIDVAHRAGVLHRDLKPENILLPDSGRAQRCSTSASRRSDATAHRARRHATQGATIIGTPAYMAPEQLRGESVDGRADVYSLAVLTYEALTGRLAVRRRVTFVDIGIRQADGAHACIRGRAAAARRPRCSGRWR